MDGFSHTSKAWSEIEHFYSVFPWNAKTTTGLLSQWLYTIAFTEDKLSTKRK